MRRPSVGSGLASGTSPWELDADVGGIDYRGSHDAAGPTAPVALGAQPGLGKNAGAPFVAAFSATGHNFSHLTTSIHDAPGAVLIWDWSSAS